MNINEETLNLTLKNLVFREVWLNSMRRNFGVLDGRVFEYSVLALIKFLEKGIVVNHIYPYEDCGIIIEVKIRKDDSDELHSFTLFSNDEAHVIHNWNDKTIEALTMGFDELIDYIKDLQF